MTYKLPDLTLPGFTQPSFTKGLLALLAMGVVLYFGASGIQSALRIGRAHAQDRAFPLAEFQGLADSRAKAGGAGQGGAPVASPGVVDGNALVAQAARRVQAEPSVQAQIRFRIDAAGQNLLGNGQYVQLGDGPEKLLRFDLKLQVAERTAALQQISGQQYYWVRRDLPPAAYKVARVNLRTVRNAIAKEKAAPERDEVRPAVPSPGDDAWLLLGGLPALLESLHRDFEFTAARAGEIEYPVSSESRARRMPVWAVSGKWKPDRWKELTTTTGKKSKHESPMSLPERVDLVLGRNERSFGLFPYRVIYYARALPGEAGQGSGTGELVPLVSMEFFNVQPAAELDPRDFDYNPGEQEIEDLTQAYLVKLGLPVK
ncbi:hypothetical protein [Anatilimnocola aggregata]|nr:hypothetical protein [Anatilimnocola aggregata]